MATEVVVLNPSKVPPFEINSTTDIDESLRLRYRYLYLRRRRMSNNLLLRHRVVKFIRDFLAAQGFSEIETPMLIKSTPEGARDYLVPSRLHPGSFYALPQSPQQLKQLLMVAGFEKYFQIARCFRDEDARADRQPEFTQLDLEMSFVTTEDILDLTERLYTGLVTQLMPEKRILRPFPRLQYQEAIERFGSDKPDLRYSLELVDITPMMRESRFEVFRRAVALGGIVKGFSAPGCGHYTRREIDQLTKVAVENGAKGLVTFAIRGTSGESGAITEDDIQSPVSRFFELEEVRGIARDTGARGGDLILLAAGDSAVVHNSLGALRHEMGRRLRLGDPDLLGFGFVLGFPLFQWDNAIGKWDSVHHPFTTPWYEDMSFLETDPGRVRSHAYDLICNEYELGSGSIRIHNRSLQEKVFTILGYSQSEMEDRFGHLLEALDYGAPPHGGIAPGIDRLVMVLAGETSLREVIAFPKTQSALDLLFGAPSPVLDAQLTDLHLRLQGSGE